MADTNILVELSADAEAVMEERGVRLEDIQAVIGAAEASGERLYTKDGRFLAKKRLDNIMAYAEYTLSGDTATVMDTYAHRVSLKEEN